jgi:Mg2+ and Co2+ transporter CorA
MPLKTRRETALFQRFERDSGAAAHWLKTHDRTRKFYLEESTKEHDAEDSENEEDDWLREDDEKEEYTGTNRFVDRLLNIASEAKLLVECKDIQDELGIITTILRQQKAVLHDMERALKHASGIQDDGRREELTSKISHQQRSIDLCMMDLVRMDKQAESVNTNLTQVLDLKQKHANALEARFQRDQAQDTARSGQTIMIFTIVTIVFLPMSFIASFFAINIKDLPHDSNGNGGLPLGFVSKYLFGIGLAVSIPLIFIAFVFTDMAGLISTGRRKLGWGKKRRPGRDRLSCGSGGGAEEPVEKLVAVEEPRHSADWSIGRHPSRVDTGKTDRSRITEDLEMG